MMTMFKGYNTRTFQEIFEEYEDFKDFYDNCGIETTIREEDITGKMNSLKNLYYLLLARYANSPIASFDEVRFKLQTMSIIFQYGATWQKRVDLQKEIREKTVEEMASTVQIYNQALNPETAHATTSEEGIEFTNNQTVTHNKRNALDAYMQYDALIKSDVTGEFLDRFKVLFNTMPPTKPILYFTEEE